MSQETLSGIQQVRRTLQRSQKGVKEGFWLNYLGLPTSVLSTWDWTSLDLDVFSSSISSSFSSSSIVLLFCSFKVELRWWESWVVKSLLREERESRWTGSRGHQAALQERQVFSSGVEEEEEEQTQLEGEEGNFFNCSWCHDNRSNTSSLYHMT